MTFEIDIDGQSTPVSVEAEGLTDAAGGRFVVRLEDGTGGRFDCRLTDLGLSIVDLGTGRSIDIAVTERARGEWLIQLPHVDISAAVDGRRFGRGRADQAGGSGEQRVVAPMPGRVVRILVKPGDEVVARQGLVIIEAMKMENELTVLRPGRVKDVAVTEGTSVEAGRLLVVVE